MTQPKFSPGRWDYVGDVVVGVVADCCCPAETKTGKSDDPDVPGHMSGFTVVRESLHESHDLIKPVFEEDLPEGVSMKEWQDNCRLWAASKEMHRVLTTCADYLCTVTLTHDHKCLCHTCELRKNVYKALTEAETGKRQ